MTCTINASTSNGIVSTADGSGIIKLQSAGVTTNALAWAYIAGSGTTPTVTASYNVSSITRNGTGTYQYNFTSALSDANFPMRVGEKYQEMDVSFMKMELEPPEALHI